MVNKLVKLYHCGVEYEIDGGSDIKPEVDILLVGGGGSGGTAGGGGGGGGGIIDTCGIEVSPGNYSIIIGAGGCEAGTNNCCCPGCNGGDTCAFGYIAYGGGGGGTRYKNGCSGGNGGGGGESCSGCLTCGGVCCNFGGGKGGGSNAANTRGGGGGGGGGDGCDSIGNIFGGFGGPGYTTSIRGIKETFAGGGGAASTSNACGVYACGGIGGGGAGTWCVYCCGEMGEECGAGGGGAVNACSSYHSGKGGGGIAIIKYKDDGSVKGRGGMATMINGYIVHTFEQSGTFEVLPGDCKGVKLLVVGGGGSGGGVYSSRNGGGGGGGGVVFCPFYGVSGSYNVVVGNGGTGHISNTGCRGGDSCFGSIVAYGGGGGGNTNYVGQCKSCGGSGGGGAYNCVCCGGKGVCGQGHDGGGVCGSLSNGPGGGGAYGPGRNFLNYLMVGCFQCTSYAWQQQGGNGGCAMYNDISGEGKYYGGGGGGGGCYICRYGVGGCGAGGLMPDGTVVLDAVDGTGGGGAGGGCINNLYVYGGNGGKGIVIVGYHTDGSDGVKCATGGTVYTCGDYTIHCFTSNGIFTVVS